MLKRNYKISPFLSNFSSCLLPYRDYFYKICYNVSVLHIILRKKIQMYRDVAFWFNQHPVFNWISNNWISIYFFIASQSSQLYGFSFTALIFTCFSPSFCLRFLKPFNCKMKCAQENKFERLYKLKLQFSFNGYIAHIGMSMRSQSTYNVIYFVEF